MLDSPFDWSVTYVVLDLICHDMLGLAQLDPDFRIITNNYNFIHSTTWWSVVPNRAIFEYSYSISSILYSYK